MTARLPSVPSNSDCGEQEGDPPGADLEPTSTLSRRPRGRPIAGQSGELSQTVGALQCEHDGSVSRLEIGH